PRLRELVAQVSGPRLRRGGGVEARDAGYRNELVAPGSLDPLRVDEHERVVPKIGQRGEARRQRLVVEDELQGTRVAAEKGLDRRGMGAVGARGGDRLEKRQEVLTG